MEAPGGLRSMGALGVGHDWATSLSLFTLMLWRRKWQPTPVFLPGESQGRGSLVAAVYGVARSWPWLKWLSSSSSSVSSSSSYKNTKLWLQQLTVKYKWLTFTKLFAFNFNETMFLQHFSHCVQKKLDCDQVHILASFPSSQGSPQKDGYILYIANTQYKFIYWLMREDENSNTGIS